MGETFALAGLVSGLAALVYGWHRTQLRRTVLGRLHGPAAAREPLVVAPPVVRPFVRPHRLIPWIIGAAVGAVLWYFVGLHPMFSVLLGAVAGLLGNVWDQQRVERRAALIEMQLANAIDIMVASLRAGSGLSAAIESALVEARRPLYDELNEILGRLRLGDEPLHVFENVMRRVPLETFRLFAATLATHWEVGGSLAPTLATVGRTIRDRIEVSRRIRSMTAQSRVSIIAILAATYFIALVMWRNDPQRMVDFLSTRVGRMLVVGAVGLQAIGIAWSTRMGKVKY
jgi:Flp pilus assembly protein TadB